MVVVNRQELKLEASVMSLLIPTNCINKSMTTSGCNSSFSLISGFVSSCIFLEKGGESGIRRHKYKFIQTTSYVCSEWFAK